MHPPSVQSSRLHWPFLQCCSITRVVMQHLLCNLTAIKVFLPVRLLATLLLPCPSTSSDSIDYSTVSPASIGWWHSHSFGSSKWDIGNCFDCHHHHQNHSPLWLAGCPQMSTSLLFSLLTYRKSWPNSNALPLLSLLLFVALLVSGSFIRSLYRPTLKVRGCTASELLPRLRCTHIVHCTGDRWLPSIVFVSFAQEIGCGL